MNEPYQISARPKQGLKPVFNKPGIDMTPERELMVGIMDRAFHDLMGIDDRMREDAYKWFLGVGYNRSPRDLHSVQNICEQLKFDYRRIRLHVKALYESGERLSCIGKNWSKEMKRILEKVSPPLSRNSTSC